MKTFRDNANRDWTVDINVAALKRVRDQLGINLLDVLENDCRLLVELYDDPIKFVDVLYCLCQPQAAAQGVSDEQFGAAMAGDVLAYGLDSFMESLCDFFRSPKQRSTIREVMATMSQIADRLLDHAAATVAALDVDSLANQLINSVGNSAGGSDSIPVPAHSAN